MPTAEQLTAPVAEHGEGPVWDEAGQQLLSVDLERGVLVRHDPATGGTARHRVADVLACLRPRTAGGWVLAAERRFAVLDAVPPAPVPGPHEGPQDGAHAGPQDGPALAPTMLPPLWERGRVRFNEGSCDPQGRFWAGSMAWDHGEGGGTLWRLDLDGTAHPVLPGVTISNGLAWSAPGRAHYVDTPTRGVDVLHTDPATGALLGRERFATVPDDVDGVPDGLVLDAEGGVWVAAYGAGCVLRFDADGRLDERVDVAAAGTTACTFGGPDLATLYVTTSTQAGDEPGAGALFAHRPGVRGVAPLPYAG